MKFLIIYSIGLAFCLIYFIIDLIKTFRKDNKKNIIIDFIFLILLLASLAVDIFGIAYSIKSKIYENDIINQNIIFYEDISDEFIIDGLKVNLNFKVSNYNKRYSELLTTKITNELVNIIKDEIPTEIKKVLIEKGAEFNLTDRESIELKLGFNTDGYYTANDYKIYIGLKLDVMNMRKTVYHEIAHFIDNVIAEKENLIQQEIYFYSEIDSNTKELYNKHKNKFREYASKNKKEFIAVLFENYLKDNNSFRFKKYPELKELANGYLEKLNS